MLSLHRGRQRRGEDRTLEARVECRKAGQSFRPTGPSRCFPGHSNGPEGLRPCYRAMRGLRLSRCSPLVCSNTKERGCSPLHDGHSRADVAPWGIGNLKCRHSAAHYEKRDFAVLSRSAPRRSAVLEAGHESRRFLKRQGWTVLILLLSDYPDPSRRNYADQTQLSLLSPFPSAGSLRSS